MDRLLSDFNIITGMDISILDADFHTLSLANGSGNNFCSFIHRLEGAGNICKSSDIERLSQVKASLEPVIYTCPYGITEVIIPIIRDDLIVAYLISAVGINKDKVKDEEIIDGVQALYGTSRFSKINTSVSAVKHLSEIEISAHLSMLKILAEHIGNDETIIFTSESIGKLAKRYIKNNLSSKLTLSDLSRNLHCSTVTLTEHFKSEFGITIVDYITKKRMKLSEKLLITTELPLREISVLSGFADVEYFSRTFKKFHGTSPAIWRKNEKNNT